MCPPSTGLGATFNESYFVELESATTYITSRGGYAILDAHNYMRYNDPSSQPTSGSIIGNTSDPHAASTASLAAFWAELSRRFKTNPNVIYGLMNEPHTMPTSLVLSNNQAALTAIRAAGATQLVLVPGNGFTGAHRWLNTTCAPSIADCAPNADVLAAITDPAHNFAFDMHLYFDADTSGTHESCTRAAPANLQPVTQWLRAHNASAFLSEFGAGANEPCVEVLGQTLDFLDRNPEWVGWTYWAAGPLWGEEYFLSVEPGEGRQSKSVWPRVLAPRVRGYGPLVRCGVSGRWDRMGEVGGLEGCLGVRLVG